jgi:S-adenosyl-L-methionine hydrolase (adenosine-forming)
VAQTHLLGLLTDFGLRDGYVGVMKAVMLSIAPDARLVDISHEIAPQDIEGGAWTLGMAWRAFPVGSVLLCVVDPGVGSARRAVALAAHGRVFVGPDNGLFTYPLDDDGSGDDAALRCAALDDPRYHLPTPSATFHGRDIFAPCAARLANGTPLEALGSALDPAMLVRLPIALRPQRAGDVWVARVAHVDHFGNLITNIGAALTRRALEHSLARISLAQQEISARASHFAAGPQDEPFFLQDSSGALAIAQRDGSAAQALGAQRGDEVILRGLADAEDVG